MNAHDHVKVAVHGSAHEWNDPQAVAKAASAITPIVVEAGGHVGGQTTGMLVYTMPLAIGFPAIESMFAAAINAFPGAQWQYTNVYDLVTGEPLGWWE